MFEDHVTKATQALEDWQKPTKQVFDLWVSFFPVAPLFGVAWRFADTIKPMPGLAPFMQPGTPVTAKPAKPAPLATAPVAAPAETAAPKSAPKTAPKTAPKAAPKTAPKSEAATPAPKAVAAKPATPKASAPKASAPKESAAKPAAAKPVVAKAAAPKPTPVKPEAPQPVAKATEPTPKPSAKAEAPKPVPAPKAEAAPKPAPKATKKAANGKPEALLEKAPQKVDDLKLIKGIGPSLEQQLNGLGIYQFTQIAGFTEKDLAWVDENLTAFKGRCFRDDWVGQAKAQLA